MQQLTQKDIACVIGLYHKTHSRKQVARELGLSEYRVRRILIDNGILSDYDTAIAAAIDAGDSPGRCSTEIWRIAERHPRP
jgi:hypothetical protein